jgi:hypothetical protein
MLFTLAALAAAPAWALQVQVDVRPNVIRMGESAELIFTIQAADSAAEPRLPDVAGLRFGTPRVEQRFSMQTVNGRMTEQRSTIYRYAILPTQPGTYEIGPLTYRHAGQQVTLPTRTLQVVMGDQTTNQNVQLEDLVFARLEVNKDRIYVHEPLSLTISIYSREVNIGREVTLINMPESGIQSQPFQELRTTREVVDNNVFDVRRYQTKIRPLTAGTLRFAPGLRVQLLVPRAQQSRRGMFNDPFFGGLFTNMEAHPLDLNLPPVDVVVQSLPEANRPADFSGGVGRFNLQTRIEPDTVQPGDPITLTILLEGEGNMDAVAPPSIEDSDLFRVYPPRLTTKELDQSQSRGRKVYEQVIIPRTATSDTIPALRFHYFDPQTEAYQTLTRGPFPLTLEAGETVAGRVVRGASEERAPATRVLGEDIIYLKPLPADGLRRTAANRLGTPMLLTLQILPAMALLAVWWQQRRRRALDADVAKARRYRAPRSARPGLTAAETAIRQADQRAFFDALWSALTAYFGDRLNLPAGAVTGTQVQQTMQAAGLGDANLDRINRLFEACEQQRYAGVAITTAAMETLLADCKQILKACEKVKT